MIAAFGPGAAAAEAATRYVSTSGNDTANNCLTQAPPCATIQHAIDEATAGDTIEVSAGTYSEGLIVGKAVDLRGPNAEIDPNTGSRVSEAVIDAGDFTGIIPEVPGISIDGFTVSTTDPGFPIYTSGTDITGLTVSNNILGSGVRALTIATSGEDLSILNNLVEGDIYGIHFGNGTFANVKINENVVLGPVTTNSIFINGFGTIDGFELLDNTITDGANIAANISEGLVSGNAFDVEGGGLNLQISLHDSVLTENSFDGNGDTNCLQIFGSQFGLVPSKDVLVSDNFMDDCSVYGIQLSPDIEEIEITGNTITNAKQGINTRNVVGEVWDPTGQQISVVANRVVGSTEAGVANTVEGTLDVRNNWWGCNGGLGTAGCAASIGSVETTPHLVLSGEAVAEIGLGASAQVTARLDRNSAGETIPGIPDGPSVEFASALGSFSPPSAPLAGGTASSTFTAGSQSGLAGIQVELDGEIVGVPLTIAAPPVQSPPPTTPPPPPVEEEEPEVEVPGGGEAQVVPKSGNFKLATVDCPAESCTLRSTQPVLKVGGKTFKVRAKFRKELGQDGSTKIRIILPRAARKALAESGKGRIALTLSITTADGSTETVKLSVKIKLKKSGKSSRK